MLGWEGPLTHRQYQVWQLFLDDELDHPTKTESYLMQVACEVRRGQSKKPNSVKLEHFRLRYKNPKIKKSPANLARESWVAQMQMPVKVIYVNAAGESVETPE